MNDILAWFGVTQAFAGQAFHGRWILQRAQLGIEPPADFGLLFDPLLQRQFLFPHSLVLLNHRLIPEQNAQHAGDDQQHQHQPEKIVPNTASNAHRFDQITSQVK